MRTFDFAPLFRSTVGFDHLARLLDATTRIDEQSVSYPPYNIEKLSEDSYRISMAVAGFSEKEIEVTSEDRSLVISGKSARDESGSQYLHRGLAARAFERRFQLADHIRVTGANLVNGLLHVELAREVPEAKKPRTIAVGTQAPTQSQAASPQVEEKKAA